MSSENYPSQMSFVNSYCLLSDARILLTEQ
jgi:hypothetical protein